MNKGILATDDNNIRVYVLIAESPKKDPKRLSAFAEKLTKSSVEKLQEETSSKWQFHMGDVLHLDSSETRRPDDFLREAFLRMVQNSCDLVLVITDVGLVSASSYMVPGLAAPESQVAVISTRKLLTVPAGEPVRDLEDPSVHYNATNLLLHLIGHIMELRHSNEGIMAPYEFIEGQRNLKSFSDTEKQKLAETARKLKVREFPAKGGLSTLKIHLASLAKNPADIARISWRSKALLMPFSLTKITTAAIAPAILMFFTDEFWWVGIHRNPVYIWTAAVAAILAATFYIPSSQDLLFPHREKRVITSNVATANLGMLLSIFLMVIGLFIVVSLAIMLLEVWLFPPELIIGWFEGFNLEVTWYDHFKIAVVVGTLGTLTGALGSGFHGRDIIRAVSFFEKEP